MEVYHTVCNNGKISIKLIKMLKWKYSLWNDTVQQIHLYFLLVQMVIKWKWRKYIAYCFAEKTGYSKFGKYTGNANADGTFVYTGFKPCLL